MSMSYSSSPSFSFDNNRHSHHDGHGPDAPGYPMHSHDPTNNTPPPPPPLCSVLATVFDYIMTDPSPLEPREFRQSSRDRERLQSDSGADDENPSAPSFESFFPRNMTAQEQAATKNTASAIQVPVIRIFGPIIRRDKQTNPAKLKPPTQSACLYIHGAFPYLLARPVIAGPDGGPGRYSLTPEQRRQHTDWDDADAVQSIVPILHDALEATLQTSVHGTGNQGTKSNNKPYMPFIRQVSVVMGRGFYTYCPGPAAPFLRIEYYNPAQRWRIKAALEHGLPDIPYQFYPHPKQYSYGSDDETMGTTSERDDEELATDEPPPEGLLFHCYEAHIPYSMQFFKDYNLAGLSYIHLEQGLFRRPLPLGPSIRRIAVNVEDHQQGDNPQRNEQLFLQSNTDSVWPLPVANDEVDGSDENAMMDQPVLDNLPDLHQATPPDFNDDGSSCDSQPPPEQQLLSSIPTQASSDPSEASKLDLMTANLPGGVWSESKTSCEVELDTTVAHILNVHDVLTEKQESHYTIHWRAVPSLETIWNQERRRMRKLLPPRDDFLSQLQQPSTPPLTLHADSSRQSGAHLAQQGMERLTRVTDGLYESHKRVAKDIVARHAAQLDQFDADMVRWRREAQLGRRDVGMALLGDAGAKQESVLTPTDEEALNALEALGGGVDAVKKDIEMASEGILKPTSSAWSHREQSSLSQALEASRDEPDHLPSSQLVDSISFSQMPYSQASESSVQSSKQQQLSASERLELALSQRSNFFTQRMGSNRKGVDWSSEKVLTDRIDRGDGILDGPLENVDEFIDPLTLRPYEDLEDDETIAAEEQGELDEYPADLGRPDYDEGQFDDSHVDTSPAYDDWRPGSQEIETVDMAGQPSLDNLDETEDLEPLTAPIMPLSDTAYQALSLELAPGPPALASDIQVMDKPPTRGDFLRTGGKALLPMERGHDQPQWLHFTSSYFKRYPNKWLSSLLLGNIPGRRYSITRTRPPPRWKTVASWAKRKSCQSGAKASEPVQKRQRINDPGDEKGLLKEERKVEEVEWRSSQPALSQSQRDEPQSSENDMIEKVQDKSFSMSLTKSTPDDSITGDSRSSPRALEGIGAQGGKLHIEGGGQLKAAVRPSQWSTDCGARELPTPVSLMVVEIHVQCRKGKDISSRPLALTPQAERDRVSAIVYVLAIDPGGGEALEVVERGCLLVPPSAEIDSFNDDAKNAFLSKTKFNLRSSMPSETMGKASPLSIECFLSEKKLIQRFSHIVRWKDPDLLCSWDTQGAGLGFLIERSSLINDNNDPQSKQGGIDLARYCGRTPSVAAMTEVNDEDPFQLNHEGFSHAGGLLDEKKNKWKGSGMGADWDDRVGAGVAAASIVGRLVFASWKLVAEEVKHPNASYLQAVVSTVTGKRIPFHDNLKLTSWYSDNKGRERWRVLHYRLVQAMSTVVLFDAMDVIGRAGEAAKLSGVELSHSFPGIRGSQYKVEGVLLRALQSLSSDERGTKIGRSSSSSASASLTGGSTSQSQSPWKGRHALNTNRSDAACRSCDRLANRQYFFFSPSLKGADKQEALQVQALTLEPKSGHYHDPVVVCDFTALYPSLVIAYNLCYSTIGGHFDYQTTRDEMQKAGRTTGKVGPFAYQEGRSATILKHHLRSLNDSNQRDRAYIAPTGDIYVSETVVKGVLPQVLDEMLTTRAMLKKAAKLYKHNVKDLPPAVLRQLEARQLALKYVANVTYGYTSATFSGRCAMPLLADTIVECGRRTLTSAINLANSWGSDATGRWKGCSVIYGDTDSIFVKLPGRSVHEAFQFGEEFCRTVTQNNPPPVQLKLEKVYMGSIMQTKKKYCGMKFESVDQKKPEFEAKGIETVRRDQCILTQKVLRNALITLFRHGVPAVREYLVRQWRLIEAGKLPVSDFILTGRVRSKYRASLPVQAALLQRLNQYDPGRNVRHKERLAYVIVASPGKAVRLSDAVLTPLELMEHWDLHTLNTTYYIMKHVNAALQRCLSLEPHRVDVHEWYRSSPKSRRRIHYWPSTGKSAMISSFF